MKRIVQGIGLSAAVMMVIFSGCKPSVEEQLAREAKLRQACESQLSTAATGKDLVALNAAIDKAHAKLKAEVSVPMVQQAIDRMISAGHYDAVEQTAAYISSKKKLTHFQEMATATVLKNRIAAKRWEALPEAIMFCVNRLPEAVSVPLLRQSLDALKKNKQMDILEKTCPQVWRASANKPLIIRTATATWVDANVAKDKKLLPSSLEALLKEKIAPEQVGILFDRHFYNMIDDKEIVKQLCAVGSQILAMCKDESTIQSIKLKMLDGAFITENYDLAVEMLEKGIPGKDKEWHDTTIPKVKAHRALAKNKPLEAIENFRQFMTEWKNAKQTEEFDPSTGMAYSREWILGRNAVRISKIYASIPDAENQKKALVEADDYFKEALTKVDKNSEELKALTKEIKDAGL
jgi:hypothetical protein